MLYPMRRLLTWNDIEWFSEPLHIINKLGQFMSILSRVNSPVEKNQKNAKIPSNYRKNEQNHQVENFVKKYCSFFYLHIEKFKRK